MLEIQQANNIKQNHLYPQCCEGKLYQQENLESYAPGILISPQHVLVLANQIKRLILTSDQIITKRLFFVLEQQEINVKDFFINSQCIYGLVVLEEHFNQEYIYIIDQKLDYFLNNSIYNFKNQELQIQDIYQNQIQLVENSEIEDQSWVYSNCNQFGYNLIGYKYKNQISLINTTQINQWIQNIDEEFAQEVFSFLNNSLYKAHTFTGQSQPKAHQGNICKIQRINYQTIVSCSEDNSVTFWNPCNQKAQLIKQFNNNNQCFRNFCTSDYQLFAICDNQIVKIDPLKYIFQQIFTIKDQLLSICDLSNNYLACADIKGNIYIFNTQDIQQIIRIQSQVQNGHKSSVNVICALNENQIVTGGGEGELKIWNWREGSLVKNLEGHNEQKQIHFIQKFPNKDTQLISAGSDQSIRIWDLINGIQIKKIQLNNPIYCGCLLNEFELAIGDLNVVRIFNLKTWEYTKIQEHLIRINSISQISSSSFITGDIEGNMIQYIFSNSNKNRQKQQSSYETSISKQRSNTDAELSFEKVQYKCIQQSQYQKIQQQSFQKNESFQKMPNKQLKKCLNLEKSEFLLKQPKQIHICKEEIENKDKFKYFKPNNLQSFTPTHFDQTSKQLKLNNNIVNKNLFDSKQAELMNLSKQFNAKSIENEQQNFKNRSHSDINQKQEIQNKNIHQNQLKSNINKANIEQFIIKNDQQQQQQSFLSCIQYQKSQNLQQLPSSLQQFDQYNDNSSQTNAQIQKQSFGQKVRKFIKNPDKIQISSQVLTNNCSILSNNAKNISNIEEKSDSQSGYFQSKIYSLEQEVQIKNEIILQLQSQLCLCKSQLHSSQTNNKELQLQLNASLDKYKKLTDKMCIQLQKYEYDISLLRQSIQLQCSENANQINKVILFKKQSQKCNLKEAFALENNEKQSSISEILKSEDTNAQMASECYTLKQEEFDNQNKYKKIEIMVNLRSAQDEYLNIKQQLYKLKEEFGQNTDKQEEYDTLKESIEAKSKEVDNWKKIYNQIFEK